MEQPRTPQRPSGMPPGMRPVHRPAAVQPQTAPVVPPTPTNQPKDKKRSVTFAMIGLGLVSLLIVLTAIGMGYQKLMANLAVKPGKYQAVFLSNNMVYFGKIGSVTDEYVKLSDIFYIQVQQQQQTDKNQEQQLSLTKLGNELHGPEDVMYINRKEIMFWENLKDDGKVVQAIKNYQQKK